MTDYSHIRTARYLRNVGLEFGKSTMSGEFFFNILAENPTVSM